MVELPVGYLVTLSDPNREYLVCCLECLFLRVLCPDCGRQITDTPVYQVNLAQYQQHCCFCEKSINPKANPFFPELFDGRERNFA